MKGGAEIPGSAGFISASLYVQVSGERNVKQLIFRRVKRRCIASCLAEFRRTLLDGGGGKVAAPPPPLRANCVITSRDNILHSGFACQTAHIHLQSDIFMEHAEWADSSVNAHYT